MLSENIGKISRGQKTEGGNPNDKGGRGSEFLGGRSVEGVNHPSTPPPDSPPFTYMICTLPNPKKMYLPLYGLQSSSTTPKSFPYLKTDYLIPLSIFPFWRENSGLYWVVKCHFVYLFFYIFIGRRIRRVVLSSEMSSSKCHKPKNTTFYISELCPIWFFLPDAGLSGMPCRIFGWAQPWYTHMWIYEEKNKRDRLIDW